MILFEIPIFRNPVIPEYRYPEIPESRNPEKKDHFFVVNPPKLPAAS